MLSTIVKPIGVWAVKKLAGQVLKKNLSKLVIAKINGEKAHGFLWDVAFEILEDVVDHTSSPIDDAIVRGGKRWAKSKSDGESGAHMLVAIAEELAASSDNKIDNEVVALLREKLS